MTVAVTEPSGFASEWLTSEWLTSEWLNVTLRKKKRGNVCAY